MKPLRRLWPAIESVPGLKAVEAEWIRRLSTEYGLARQYLVVTGELATSYPAIDQDEPRPIATHGEDDFAAICPRGGESIALRRTDVLVRRFDNMRLARALGKALGATLIVDALTSHCRQPYLLLAPTRRWVNAIVESKLDATEGTFFAMCDLVQPTTDGHLQIPPLVMQSLATMLGVGPTGGVTANVFQRQSDKWVVSFEGTTIYEDHSAGLIHLARLLAEPHKKIPVVLLDSNQTGVHPDVLKGSSGALMDYRVRRPSAATRYVVLGAAMVMTVILSAATWSLLPGAASENPARQAVLEFEYESASASSPAADPFSFHSEPMMATDLTDGGPAIEAAESNVLAEVPSEDSPPGPTDVHLKLSWSERATALLRPRLAWIVVGWCVGVVLFSLRPLLGWRTLRRLRRVEVSPVSDDVSAALRRVSGRLGLRKEVCALHSTLARVPIVVGYFRPVILLPVTLVLSIPPAQLEAIRAHELGHARRHDFLVNLLQTLGAAADDAQASAAVNEKIDEDTRSGKQQDRETDAQQEPADEASTERAPTPDEVFARRVSLRAKKMPLKRALAQFARQAGVELQLDVEALNAVELNVDDPVTASFQDEPLDVAIGRLIDWRDHPGAFLEFRAGRLVLTTIGARQRQVARHLPDRLKPLYTHGLLAKLDEDHKVESITASSIWTDDLLEYLATLPKLRELHIEVTKSITPAGLKHLGQLRNLENVSLYEVNQDGNGLGDESMRAIAGLQSLRELRVNNCGLTDAGARHLQGLPQLSRLELDEGRLTDTALASIGKLRQLKHLSLSSYVGTAQYGRMHFTATGLPSLAGLRELEELHLVGQDVTADLLSWPQLKSLSLGGSTVDDACAERIAACRELKSLSLVYTAVSDRGIQQIATLPLLRRLNLDSRVITDEAMNHLKAVKSLEMLTLRATRLTDESLRHVSEMKSLGRLDLHGSGQPGAVTGENFSISALRQLKALPKLHTLWLTNFRSPGGYLGLAELTQLRELSLMMADIRTEDLDALEAALPNTTIHCASGGGFRRPIAKRGPKTAPNQ